MSSSALRPLGAGELLDTAVRLAYRNAPAALLVAVPFAIVRAALDAPLRYAAASGSTGDYYLAALGEIALSCLLGTILAGLLAPLFVSARFGERIDAAESLRRARGSLAPLVGLAVIVTIAQTAGLLLLGVGGVWLWGLWAVAAPALVVERTGVRRGLGRSVALVRAQFWRAWGIRALRWVVTGVLGLLITLPFTVLAAAVTDSNPFRLDGISDAGLYVTIRSIGDLLALCVALPISAAVDALLYLDLRARREGLDILLALPQPVGRS